MAMKFSFPSLLALTYCLASSLMLQASEPTTTVYKKIMPDGSVSYSDQNSASAQSMEVAPVPTVPAVKVPNRGNQTPEEDEQDAPYKVLAVSSPANDTAFYSGNGSMSVSIAIEPSLKRRHNLQLILDGQVVGTQKSNTFNLARVDRGTHDLQINVIDRAGNIVQSAQSKFTIHRPIVKANRPRSAP